MDVAVEDINLLLSDLELGVRPQAEKDATFAKSSSLVVEQVRHLERAFLLETGDQAAAGESVRGDGGIVDIAIARGMPRPAKGIDDSLARAEALSFMRSELQVLCIEAHRKHKQNQPLLAGLELTAAQRQTMERVHASIAADFTLRRRMLLRRCDVTVQSFLRDSDGGRKAVQGGGGAEVAGGGGGGGAGGGGGDEGKFASLPPALRAKRQGLSDEPRTITVDDALAAPISLAWRHAQRITEGGGGGGGGTDSSAKPSTSIKTAEIAEVSDRGGRVDDAREGPAWKTQKEFDRAAAAGKGRGGRGGGGSRGGGGGEGRSGRKGRRKGGGGGSGSGGSGGGGGGGGGNHGGGRGGGGGGGGGGQERHGGGNRGGGCGGGGGGGGGRGGGGNKRKWGGGGERFSR
eukprot:g6917.t1